MMKFLIHAAFSERNRYSTELNEAPAPGIEALQPDADVRRPGHLPGW
jgi:hypothetical protein